MTEKKPKETEITAVAVHPIVLLSIADHHNRVMAEDEDSRRVIGILLGDFYKGTVNVYQCFGVPFVESLETGMPSMDKNFIHEMALLHTEANHKEKIVGWYSSQSSLSPNDLDINDEMKEFCRRPVFITTDVGASDPHEIPVQAFVGTQSECPNGQPMVKAFKNLPTTVEFSEVEEIGVEHLLRDIKDVDMSAIGTTLTNSIHGLAALEHRLANISDYLEDVIEGRLPMNNEVNGLIQSVFNLLPNLNFSATVDALKAKCDDSNFMIFMSQMCRSVVALHELVKQRHPGSGDNPDHDGSMTI